MRVLGQVQEEQHFFEGEPDLEPPEESAVGELDDQDILEEELDNEDVLEEDVDEDALTVSLEHLIHVGDDDGAGDGVSALGRSASADGSDVEDLDFGGLDGAEDPPGALDVDDDADVDERLDALEVDDLEDLEESLDRLLEERLTPDVAPITVVSTPSVASCRADEFVCHGCFLVRLRSQLADPATMLCRDCQG